MRIAHLVLYTEENAHEQAMMQLQRFLYDDQENVQTIYYTYSYHVRNIEYDATERILRIPGHESYIPGILLKTWTAFEWAMQHMQPYDYLLRTNISTLMNFPLFFKALKQKPVRFGGMHTLTVGWYSPHSGIYDNSFEGVQFPSGFAIIWNAETFAHMLSMGRPRLNLSVVDDVAIGLLMKDLGVYPPEKFSELMYIYSSSSCNHHPSPLWPAAQLHELNQRSVYQELELKEKGSKMVAFRHHALPNRTLDVRMMGMTLRYLHQWILDARAEQKKEEAEEEETRPVGDAFSP